MYIIVLIYIYIYRERERGERELGYSTMHSMDLPRAMGRFFILKVQMVDLTVQNDFHMNIEM
jgi:hypothetical protein